MIPDNKEQNSIPKAKKKYRKYSVFNDLNDLFEDLKAHGLNSIKWNPSPFANIIEITLDKVWFQIDKETQDYISNNFEILYSGNFAEIRILAFVKNLDNEGV